jgi:uncharacterized membrane protein
MTPNDLAISRRLTGLERRLDAVERRLGLHQAPPEAPAASALEAAPGTAPTDAEPAARAPERLPEPLSESDADRVADAASIESFIGRRLFAVVGALIVIAGAGLGLKLAWDLGVLANISDAGKSALMAAFGASLLIVGGVARTRSGRAAGEGFTAAGLGVLFATVYAMVGPFDLLIASHSLLALAIVAAIGFWISARGGYVVAPAVAVVGAFLVPLLSGASDAAEAVLPSYWLAVIITAYALTAALGARFAAARASAWWLALIVGGSWALAESRFGAGGRWPLAFLASLWAIVHLELWRASAIAPRDNAWSHDRLVRAIAAALTTSLWTLSIGLAAMNRMPKIELWILPAALAAASALIARLVAPVGARLLRDPRDPLERLGVALALQSGALAVIAILIGGGDWTRALATAAVGVSAMAIAARFGSAWLRVYALATLFVGTVFAITPLHLIGGPAWTPGGLILTRWSLLVALAGVAWIISAWIERSRAAGAPLAAGGAALFALALVNEYADPRWLAGAWAALSVLALAAGRVAPTMRTGLTGAVGLQISTIVWIAAYASTWDAGPTIFPAPGVHEGLLMAIAFVALLTGAAVELTRGPGSDAAARPFGIFSAIVAGALLLLATSLEIGRLAGELLTDETARRAALSIWWGVFAIGVLALGRRLELRAVRLTALGLLGVATAKAVVWDLAAVAPGWRVGSFLLLGLILLGVATAYARSEARLRSGR